MTWFYANDGKQLGPVSEAEFEHLAQNGTIRPDTLVWQEGMPGWVPYAQLQSRPAALAGETAASLSPAGPATGEVPAGPAAGEVPAGPAAGEVPAGPAAGEVVCTECRQIFPRDQAINYGTVWVCAACKPAFVQKLKEGAPGPVTLATGDPVLPYAGFWIRLVARFIDGLIEGVILGIPMILFVISSMGGLTGGKPPGGAQIAMQVLFQAASLLFSVGYNTFFIGRFAATPGKMAVGVKVVTPDGGRVSYMRAFGRAWADRLSSMICLIGYIIAAFDDQKRALHDHMCATRVIYK